MKGAWQHQIYLATIDKLDDYYNADAKFIINAAPIDKDGNFVLEGDNLPSYSQFYRLYLVKEEHSEFNACLFVGGEEHNFLHLVLDNESSITIQADSTVYAPFGECLIEGDKANQLMNTLGKLVYPGYLFYEIKFPSELKFSHDKLNRDLFHFVDTCSNILVALAAITNTDFDTYFETRISQYQRFGEELTRQLPKHPYTKDYFRKMRYYGEDVAPTSSFFLQSITAFLACLVIFLAYQNFQLRRRLNVPLIEQSNIAKYELTPQEVKILQFIKENKSNKEIARELFIEVSTVKSHINKLYAKLRVKNRKEAINRVKNLDLQGL